MARVVSGVVVVASTLLGGCGEGALGGDPAPGWHREGSGLEVTLAAVGPGKGIPSSVIFAEGDSTPPNRVVVRYSGTTWEPTAWPSGIGCLTCKVPRSATIETVDFNLAGGRKVSRYDKARSAWITEETPAAGELQAIGGADFRHVWAVGDGGSVVRFDGARWTKIASPTTESLRAVWAPSAEEAWMVGDAGTILRFTAGALALEPSDTAARLLDVWGPGTLDVFAVGEHGTIVHRRP